MASKQISFPGLEPPPGHTCHARRCDKRVPPEMLMCRHHWRMVPPALQEGVWKRYRRGQEIDKRPSAAYLTAAEAAVAAVAELEAKGRR